MSPHRNSAPRSAFRNRFAMTPVYAALLAAAVLSGCTTGAAWRSSSAMTGDRAPGKVAAAPGHGSQAQTGQASSTAGKAGTAAEGTSASNATAPAVRPEPAGPSRQPPAVEAAARPGTATDSANRVATFESGAGQSSDTGAANAAQHGTTGAGTSSTDASGVDPATRGKGQPNSASGTDAPSGSAAAGAAGRAGNAGDSTVAGNQVAGNQSDTRSSTAGAGSPADRGGTGSSAQTGPASSSVQTGPASSSEGVARAADTGRGSTAAGAGGAAGTGINPAGEGGAGLDRTAGAAAAGQASSSTWEGGSALPREGTVGAAPAPRPEEVVIGMVETPGKKATPTETVIPQTLGGMLPLTLGVEGEGEFDFDKALLRDQTRTVLDELAARLKTAEFDRLEIIGHTDRIGTEVYNQYLSERRAWAVARYLIQKGVPASKVSVEGRGMHEPVTAANACAGLTREATIACMQDDRRVVISASIRRVDVNVH